MKKYINLLIVFVFAQFIIIEDAFARGGGGGSSSGGGSGEGGIIGLIIALIVFTIAWYKRKKKIEAAKILIEQAQRNDNAWNQDKLLIRVREVFDKFQKDWSEFNLESMKAYLSEEYYKRMVLELNVLKNEGRKNIMEEVGLKSAVILEAMDDVDNTKDRFIAEVQAKAKDILFDVTNNKNLYVDNNSFTEYWTFVRDGESWRLDLIRQATEEVQLIENNIADFSKRNGFYYDPDFGWLMMPNKGVIFSKASFKNSDINNHVVGYFRDKIVEFYTFIPNVQNNSNSFSTTNYIVAQTVIPKSYNDILVRRKHRFFNFGPWKLRRIKTESNDFERKFCLWADPLDQVNSFELLTPNFMEKVYDLPFELNIEVVDNFIYFYAKSRKDINYDKMLEILSWAFDEMER